jgi:predicted enzyme related to lactoylglutathione lyase
MAQPTRPAIGSIAWRDLTVTDAEGVRDFYADVVGWTAEPVGMAGYDDYNMHPPGTAEPTAGICHARGSNADVPAQWLMYVVVADLDKSLAACERLGGSVNGPPRRLAGGRFAVITDPAGAVCGLYQAADA